MLLLDPHFNPANIKLLVYDLDGTLVNAFDDIQYVVNTTLRKYGLPELTFEKIRSYVGDGSRALLERCLREEHCSGRFDEIFPFFSRLYVDNPNPTARLYPGAAQALTVLREAGFHQAVLTNKPHAVTMVTCRNLGLCELTDEIWGEDPSRPRKPEAAALELVMRRFGVSAAQTAMIGDGIADHKVARAAGAPMLAATYGLLGREQILALRPAATFDHLDELPLLLRPDGNYGAGNNTAPPTPEAAS